MLHKKHGFKVPGYKVALLFIVALLAAALGVFLMSKTPLVA